LLACASVPELAARLPEGSSDVAVRLTGDRELRRLNRSFLGFDEVTDVLAFPSVGDPGGHLGDIAISVPAATRQAGVYGHPVENELVLLCVHGFLHLLGWDHAEDAEAAEMNRLTLVALDGLGVPLSPNRLAT
jgi:probable rRNA maturation factor